LPSQLAREDCGKIQSVLAVLYAEGLKAEDSLKKVEVK
jgi:hypothetical protein